MLKGRLEDDRMLTGRGRYVADWNLPGQLYGHFLRSDRAHAEIVSIDTADALAHPGVAAVFTGADVHGVLKSLPAALPVKGRGGMELINPGRPALAPRAPLVHDQVPGNTVLDYESGDEAAARAAFERAARVVKMDVHVSRVVGNPMEPRACLAAFVSDQYHLYTCTQGVAIMRNQLSA